MAKEIERKYMIYPDVWASVMFKPEPVMMIQGYLVNEKDIVVRVRSAGARAFLTIKGISTGMTRDEFEYEIPTTDVLGLLNIFFPTRTIKTLSKKRYIFHDNFIVDEYDGENKGLIVAEIELKSVEEKPNIPEWVNPAWEVTGIPRYFNNNLIDYPYKEWGIHSDILAV